jgi:hypothetical protein
MKTGTYLTAILIAETFAWLSEGAFYHYKLMSNSWREPIILSLIANLASWQLGPMITYEVMQFF